MTGFLSALGTGLMGAVGGAADSFAGSMDQKIANRDKLANEQALMEMRDKMEQQKEARLKAAKISENKAVMGRAGEMANAERGTQMDQAKAIYESHRGKDMSDEDIALGIGATETARAEKVEPTRDNIRSAMSEGGFLSAGEMVTDMDKREATDYAHGRDAKLDEFKQADDVRAQTNSDRTYALDKRRLAISEAATRVAAEDKAVAKKDKAALAEANAQYGIILAQEHANPGSTGQAGASWAMKIMELGGNPESMEAAMLGKTTKQEVTRKTGEPNEPGGEQSTKSVVNGPRSGGVLKSGGGDSAAKAQADAQRAVSLGKISKEDANKRLIGAGFKPI